VLGPFLVDNVVVEERRIKMKKTLVGVFIIAVLVVWGCLTINAGEALPQYVTTQSWGAPLYFQEEDALYIQRMQKADMSDMFYRYAVTMKGGQDYVMFGPGVSLKVLGAKKNPHRSLFRMYKVIIPGSTTPGWVAEANLIIEN